MGNIGGGEILVILLLALIVLGPDKLPEVARQVGKAVGEMRKISSGFQREIQDAIRVADEPAPATATAATPSDVASTDAASPTETFLPTEPAALTETELADAATSSGATSDQSVEHAGTNEPGDSAQPVADDLTTMIDTADPTDTFLTTEPAALTEPIPETEPVAETEPVRVTTSYPGVVTPPEAPPLPSDVALGGDR